jgi:hypothetical protein
MWNSPRGAILCWPLYGGALQGKVIGDNAYFILPFVHHNFIQIIGMHKITVPCEVPQILAKARGKTTQGPRKTCTPILSRRSGLVSSCRCRVGHPYRLSSGKIKS